MTSRSRFHEGDGGGSRLWGRTLSCKGAVGRPAAGIYPIFVVPKGTFSMRTIRRLIEAKKAEREENGEAGFSLIELIIVVVILGILVALAVPIFANIQDSARQNAVDAAASNGATAVAAALADANSGITPANAAKSAGTTGKITVALSGTGTNTDTSNVCVTATEVVASGTPKTKNAGPGC